MAKYIRFDREDDDYCHRPCYRIVNIASNQPLGQIGWYPAWRQYTAFFYEGAVWSHDCLADVQAALITLNEGGVL